MKIPCALKQFVSVVLVLTVIGCTAMPSTVGAQDADRLLTAYIDALNASMPPAGDPAKVARLYATDGVQLHPFGEFPGGPARGREAIQSFFAGFGDFWGDWRHIETSRLVSGNRAVWEGVAEGHHKATGKHVRLPIVFFFDFDTKGAVRELRVYVDGHMVAEQLQ
jgi:ketosteroid isomerase-like protein